MCVELALAIGLATFHPTTPEKNWNEQNNIISVRCDHAVIGHMINSYGDPTSFMGLDFGYTLQGITVGVVPLIRRGYPDHVSPFGMLTYLQAGPVRVSNAGLDVVNVSVVFNIGERR